MNCIYEYKPLIYGKWIAGDCLMGSEYLKSNETQDIPVKNTENKPYKQKGEVKEKEEDICSTEPLGCR